MKNVLWAASKAHLSRAVRNGKINRTSKLRFKRRGLDYALNRNNATYNARDVREMQEERVTYK